AELCRFVRSRATARPPRGDRPFARRGLPLRHPASLAVGRGGVRATVGSLGGAARQAGHRGRPPRETGGGGAGVSPGVRDGGGPRPLRLGLPGGGLNGTVLDASRATSRE